ncbi:glycosyltransferase [Solirubrobacter soli]|uniref:glycosyltransferase n=1 Tax=Solirubrobacter soli TaxID=363832 RepID=UPI0003FA629B|nr:glycosyltransferase [Solirubrobacter soli]
MRVLIFHGYLLLGTGSNVYNAELGAALVRAGHEVHMLAQERSPFALEWVEAAGAWDSGPLVVESRVESPRATVYRPDIGGVLPVYVADVYDGIQARPFDDLTEAEIEAYLAANVAAVRDVVSLARPDVALANHLVMGPAILARALEDVPYAVKIHGSALEYTVKPYPRFRPYAVEGLSRARGVLVGSRHTAESLWTEMADPSLPGRTRLGPPGVDVDRFAPRTPVAAREGLLALRHHLAALAAADAAPARAAATPARAAGAAALPDATPVPADAAPARADAAPARAAAAPADAAAPAAGTPAAAAAADPLSGPADEVEPDDLAPPVSSFARDVREAVAALDTVQPDDRLIVFVGKLIASKGVELLLAAFPRVLAREPRARLVIVGFGAFRDGLERLAAQLIAGDLEAAAATRAEDGRELPQLAAFFAALDDPDAYRAAAAGMGERIAFAGRLDHAELADLLPAAEAMAVTSTFPEAFGMVAAEAAACGALPVVADHSGLGEVARTLSAAVPEAAHPWLSFEVGPDAVPQLADALSGWLEAPDDLRARTREAMVEATRARYSWEGVARTVIAAAQGDLADLPEPKGA